MFKTFFDLRFRFSLHSHDILQSDQPAVQHGVRVLYGRDVSLHECLQYVSTDILASIIHIPIPIYYSYSSSFGRYTVGMLKVGSGYEVVAYKMFTTSVYYSDLLCMDWRYTVRLHLLKINGNQTQ